MNCIEKFLHPLFLSNIEIMKSRIVEYNKSVITALNKQPGRSIKPRSVKSIRSDINQPYFSCKRCDDAFDSYGKLKRHKFTEHTNSINSSSNSLLSIKQSTRNNSFAEEMLLVEDITVVNSDNSESTKYTFEDEITKKGNDKLKIPCKVCEHECEDENDMQVHLKIHEFKCSQCSYAVGEESTLMVHIAKEHKESNK